MTEDAPLPVWARPLSRLGPLAPWVAFAAALFLLNGLFRLAFVLLFWDRISSVEGWWQLVPIGVRMDSVLTSYLVAAPTLAWLLLPAAWRRRVWQPFAAWVAFWLTATVFLEAGTPGFIAQFDARPNRLMVEPLAYPREIIATVWALYKLPALVIGSLLALVLRTTWRVSRAVLLGSPDWPLGRRLLAAPLVLCLLFLGARGSLGHRAVNVSNAAFSNDNLANQLALSSTFSLGYSIYSLRHEDDPSRSYGDMDPSEMLRRVAAYCDPAAAATASSTAPVPFLAPRPADETERPCNVVVLMEESLGAEYVGCLGGLPLTPEFDRLATEGLLFTNVHCTGTRTVRGMEALVSGFLPTPGRSVVKLGLAQNGFFTVPELLRRRGYATHFIYGGESNFDSMRAFLQGNGVERVTDETDFDSPVFHGIWGVSDEDLVTRANSIFVAQGDRPFYALMLTTSNHTPFEFPDGRIELYDQPKGTVNNAMKYADHAIGLLMRLARQEAYWRNTVFLVVADHNTRTWGSDLIPVPKFHIPALMVGGPVTPGRIDVLASQVDLPVTLLALAGVTDAHPMIGRDLRRLPPDTKGRAIMQFDKTNAFMVGSDVVVQQPKASPLQFRLVDGRLVPADLNPELARDALAHALLPGWLYRNRRYGLPAPGEPKGR